MTEVDRTGEALGECLFGSAESNANGEQGNVADGLFAIARSITYLADILGRMPTGYVYKAIEKAAGSINSVAGSINNVDF